MKARSLRTRTVRWKILDAAGKTVATAADRPADHSSPTARPRSPPARKLALTRPLVAGEPVPVLSDRVGRVRRQVHDAERITFGVRTTRFDADKGFFLNGKSVKIKGTCNHQDHAGVGAALPDRLQWYRLGVLRDMGCNAVRTSHNMPTRSGCEACDRMGMMMMCETRLMSSSPEGLAQLETMIKRYRNSPAVILWSMGNEEWKLQGTPQGEHVVATMIARAHELDPTRLCTAAVNGAYGTGISQVARHRGLQLQPERNRPLPQGSSPTTPGRLGNRQHRLHPRHLRDRQAPQLGQRLRPQHPDWAETRRRMVEVLRRARIPARRLRLDRLRLSRRAHPLRLALHQLAVRHRRHVRLPQGQLLLLQSLVGRKSRCCICSPIGIGSSVR